MNQRVHGGRLEQIKQSFPSIAEEWIDLSTGISPRSYPIVELPPECFSRLPEHYRELEQAAQNYYRIHTLTAVPGSQAAIKVLPKVFQHLIKSHAVYCPAIGYQEHAWAWQDAGFEVRRYQKWGSLLKDSHSKIVVLINPNNPSTETIDIKQIQSLANQISNSNGYLIIDEAFADCMMHDETDAWSSMTNVIRLKSLGKFFGLAGLRVGFVAAAPKILQRISDCIGPWAIAGPSAYSATRALQDKLWQQQQRAHLEQQSLRLQQLLQQHYQVEVRRLPLFCYFEHKAAQQQWQQLCKLGVYVRLCDDHQALRFGLPAQHQFGLLRQRLGQLNDVTLSSRTV
ncbi:MAG: pyridoxal phosphate-dependent class II aminotransferase [Gammaproteobacteria bacterium]|nr:pyridoxal phosphate-dependent class II aminotransferase [Gammaproteobacteria bacterium]